MWHINNLEESPQNYISKGWPIEINTRIVLLLCTVQSGNFLNSYSIIWTRDFVVDKSNLLFM